MNGTYLTHEALTGGMMIGLAASLLFLLNGKIAGISGIVGGLFNSARQDKFWSIAFIAGLIGGGILTPVLLGKALEPVFVTSWWMTIIAGFLVGFGTRLGSGCTSGHGVCGLARFSSRSLCSTVIFISVAVITVYIVRHVIG
ncbi:MAG: YeeE/YedE family protein [Pseudohongiellaceae bacterium]